MKQNCSRILKPHHTLMHDIGYKKLTLALPYFVKTWIDSYKTILHCLQAAAAAAVESKLLTLVTVVEKVAV